MSAEPARLNELLVHASWIRRLARRLVTDPNVADDLVQETWLKTLSRPPRSESLRSVRGFLSRVLRNSVRERARSERHHALHEERGARDELVSSASSLVEEVDSQRVLVEEVLQLDEPQRSTVLLRYFRDMTSVEIAKSENTNAATVRSLLKRGLEELRERLDRRSGGDRSNWMLGFLAWARPEVAPVSTGVGAGTLATVKGVLVMSTALKVSAACGVIALAAVGVAKFGGGEVVDRSDELAPVQEILAGSTELSSEPTEVDAGTAEAERVAVKEEPAEEASVIVEIEEAIPTVNPYPVATILVRLVNEQQVPIEGGEVLCTESDSGRTGANRTEVETDREGRAELDFTLTSSRTDAIVQWSADGFASGRTRVKVERGETTDIGTITLHRGVPVFGRIVDLGGRPIAGAEVWSADATLLEMDPGQMARRGTETFGDQDAKSARAISDEEGRYRLVGVPLGEARIWAHGDETRYGWSQATPITDGPAIEIDVVVEPLRPEDSIAGIVLSVEGDPVPNASVRFAIHDRDFGITSGIRTEDDGRFRLIIWREVPHDLTVERDGQQANARSVVPGTHDVVLRLGTAETYDLVVTNARGEPVEEYRVTTRVGTEDSWTGSTSAKGEQPGGIATIPVPTGSFSLVIESPGYELLTLGPYEPDQVPARIDAILQVAPGFSGVVLANGVPVSGVNVYLLNALEPDQRADVNGFPTLVSRLGALVRTDDAGRFLLMPRGAGDYTLRAVKDGWAPAELNGLVVGENEGREGIELNLGKGGKLTVHVETRTGAAGVGAIVAIHCGDTYAHTKRADANGIAVFDLVKPGRWVVEPVDKEQDPSSTSSSTFSVDEDTEPFVLPWVVEVFEDREVEYTLVLEE